MNVALVAGMKSLQATFFLFWKPFEFKCKANVDYDKTVESVSSDKFVQSRTPG
jgi:hypothetical protein